MSEMTEDYPDFVCKGCAEKAGGSIPAGHLSSFHMGICPCCGHLRPLTQPRDFRYPKGLKVLYEYREATKSLGHRHGYGGSSSLEGNDRPEGEAEQP